MLEAENWTRVGLDRQIRGSSRLKTKQLSLLSEKTVRKWLLREGYASMEDITREGHFPLHTACSRGKLGIVHYLVTNGAAVDMRARLSGFTPLHFASIRNNERTARWLVDECGAPVNVEANAGTTPMMCAAHVGNIALMKFLRDNGASFASRTKPIVAVAAGRGNLQAVKWLHKQGCELDDVSPSGSSAIMHAAMRGHKDVLVWLAKKGCDFNRTNEEGDTALSWASEHGRHPIVKWLVKHGANSIHTNRFGLFPISLAASNGHLSVIEWLLGNGCPLEPKRLPMRSLTLTNAARHGQFQVVQFLVSNCQVSPLAVDGVGKSSLQYACERGHLEVFRYFVEECQIKLDYRVSRGRTLAILAAHYGRLDILRYIYSVNPRLLLLRDDSGTSILSYALDNMHSNVVQWLVAHGCIISNPDQEAASANSDTGDASESENVHEEANEGDDPSDLTLHVPPTIDGVPLMHSAIASGSIATIEFLVSSGAPIDFIDKHGYNSACLAIRYNRFPILKWLVHRGASLSVRTHSGTTPLMLAASAGHLPMFIWLLRQECCISGKNQTGSDVLTFARSSPSILHFLHRIGWTNFD